MTAQADFRTALETGDVTLLLRIHPIAFPHLPAPLDHASAEISLHMARTQADWLPIKPRAYSHRWLLERDLPSQLPDALKPSAERLYPVVVEAVLISANSNSPLMRPAMKLVEQAMSDAVSEAHADGRLSDSQFVRGRIQDARKREIIKLFGKG